MVIFIPCCKQKRSRACKARDLYSSNLFQKQLEFALKEVGEGSVFILSAKHGIVGLDDILEPYEEILIPKNSERWGGMVVDQARERKLDLVTAVYYVSSRYFQPLEKILDTELNCPFRHFSIFDRRHFFFKGDQTQQELF